MKSPTISALQSQWQNPNDVLDVLLIIGSDIVRAALAQTSGGFFVPVCFSFGWVSYSFTALISVIGEGRLLPPPDYPTKVFNLKSGYYRENKNWVIGRLLRDNEGRVAKPYPLLDRGIRISIYKALPNGTPNSFRFFAPASSSMAISGAFVMLGQLIVAAIPLILYGNWAIFLITAAGTLLALIMGALPQWKAEKLPARQKTQKNIALTSGNGSRDVMIIIGAGECLDLEELCAAETPRSLRPWEKFAAFSHQVRPATSPQTERGEEPVQRAITWSKFPVGFWLTRSVCAVESVFWLALLVTVAGLRADTWYLLAVGGIGMFQNAIIAAIDRAPETRNIPLELLECITTKKVMDGLMDLEDAYREYGSFGSHLLHEFFPGQLREEEVAWWKGYREDYEKIRFKHKLDRGVPRGIMPRYASSLDTNSPDPKSPIREKQDHGNWGYEISRSRPLGKSPAVIARVNKVSDFEDVAKIPLAKERIPEEPTNEVIPVQNMVEKRLDSLERPQSSSSQHDWAYGQGPSDHPFQRSHFKDSILNEGISNSPRTSVLGDGQAHQNLEISEPFAKPHDMNIKSDISHHIVQNPGERRTSSTWTYSKVRSPYWT